MRFAFFCAAVELLAGVKTSNLTPLQIIYRASISYHNVNSFAQNRIERYENPRRQRILSFEFLNAIMYRTIQ